MDTQTIEILGRNRLVNDLLLGGLEVALPARDRGIDLIAYIDLTAINSKFIAAPIQMKAAMSCSFSLDKKYARISNLILAYVWGVNNLHPPTTYALSYSEAFEVIEKMGWTNTSSWEKGTYSTTKPSHKLKELLKAYQMTPACWQKKILSSVF